MRIASPSVFEGRPGAIPEARMGEEAHAGRCEAKTARLCKTAGGCCIAKASGKAPGDNNNNNNSSTAGPAGPRGRLAMQGERNLR